MPKNGQICNLITERCCRFQKLMKIGGSYEGCPVSQTLSRGGTTRLPHRSQRQAPLMLRAEARKHLQEEDADAEDVHLAGMAGRHQSRTREISHPQRQPARFLPRPQAGTQAARTPFRCSCGTSPARGHSRCASRPRRCTRTRPGPSASAWASGAGAGPGRGRPTRRCPAHHRQAERRHGANQEMGGWERFLVAERGLRRTLVTGNVDTQLLRR